ncbi:MAG TPA: (2Fe-2S) ferredoxin domain-containing protein [Phototrophicaceae bacterium]|nr:(2Fe-2S) ferredoxin domain-containing protein [Phototrophicaceae bacterium]
MTEPVTPPRRRRLVLCMGEFCNLSRRSDKLYRQLQPMIAEANANGANLKLETARCLTMCGAGPNLVIYPDNLVFNQMDEAKLKALIDQYLKS